MDIQKFEDQLLVSGFRLSKSELLFRHLYRKHTLHAYRIALRLTNKDIIATEDILQESWIRAIDKLEQFKWKSSFRTWFIGIVINCTREYLRKTKPHLSIDVAEEIGVVEPLINIDLNQALAMLPHGYREILLLHDVEGYKHEEIGLMLGISEGTSKSQLFHARAAMKRMLN